MKKAIVCLDVGGTFTKGIVFDNKQRPLLEGIHYYESKSNETEEKIIENMVKIINDLLFLTHQTISKVSAIAIAFPGPFDYQEGISWITGLNKFESLYGKNIKNLLKYSFRNHDSILFEETDIFFKNDATAFAFGEYNKSCVNKGAYFTLGTGLGSTFISNNKQIKGALSIPTSGMIYNEPFGETVIDDYISARGLQKISKHYYFDEIDGKMLGKQAEKKVESALEVFKEFGSDFGKFLVPYLLEFNPDEIVLGGQISESFHFFEESIKKEFPEPLKGLTIKVSKDTSLSTLRGLFILEGMEKDHEKI